MTRSKIVRQAAKSATLASRCSPVLRNVLTDLSPDYTAEMVVLDYGGMAFPVQIFWHPKEPTALELLGLLGDELVEVLNTFVKLEEEAT